MMLQDTSPWIRPGSRGERAPLGRDCPVGTGSRRARGSARPTCCFIVWDGDGRELHGGVLVLVTDRHLAGSAVIMGEL
ncbi:hypothetical protein QJS66_17800 [Kocuria rhizophila]|nr:hypothetical protein QJS66_17800 [Kocuria rhizophila]